jgi:hypothetical protein
MSNEVGFDSPLPTRFKAWMDERFPLKNSVVSIVAYLSTALVARSVASPEGVLTLKLTDLIGCGVMFSLFLLIRVFDEHKDYELDLSNHPQRVLSRGLITLNHLKVAGAAAVLLQVLWSLMLDGGVGGATVAWVIMFAWICLMGVEFFCGEWLEKRLTLYAFSHMLVMFLIGWWAAQMASNGVPLDYLLATHLLVLFVGGFSFEITRKTRGPDEERDTVDSYSRIFGAQGAANIVMALISALALTQSVVIYQLVGIHWSLAPVALVWALTARQVVAFMKAPSLALREKNEAMVGLLMLSGFVMVIAAAWSARGVQFSLF